MNHCVLLVLVAILPGSLAQDSKPAPAAESRPAIRWSFEDPKEGELPKGWQVAETRGTGKPARWRVAADAAAPSGKQVLKVSDSRNEGGTYNLLLSEAAHPADLRLRVKLRADSGNEDQGGGLVWRARDQDNYYIARWNPLETNLRLYQVEDGRRTQLATVDITTDAKAWHELEVRMTGQDIEVWFDGKRELSHRDDTFSAGGKIGFWTKADAAVSFDDLWIAGPALPTDDGTDFADTPAWRELVRLVAEDRAPRAGAGDPLLDYQAAIENPKRLRGKAVRARGILVECVAHKLEQPAAAVKEIYRGFIMDKAGNRALVFDLPTAPPRVQPRADVVEIEGVFFRTVRYEARSGKVVEVPYVIARSLTVLDGAGK